MITVGCAGFGQYAATRFFKEFAFLEVQETHVAIPGTGTIKRWRREAPPDFRFALLAPREIGQEGFRNGKVVETALKAITDVAKSLKADTVVFVSPPELVKNRANKAEVKEFLQMVRRKFGRVIWEPPPGWDPDDGAQIAIDAKVIPARDPLLHGLLDAPEAYYRLAGPAGHKSRYEDPAIDKLAELASEATHEQATYVFTNVDMFADAKRFKKAMKMP
ncbi:MAG: DUF72 domain-containing protein [Myxococcales bacterium]|nr:DUF72 domain-containing protein [Myxococcales bacterium]